MADTATNTSELQITNLFVDGDTRKMTIPNPGTVTKTQVETLDAFLKANNFLIGDKYGGTFGRVNKAVKVSKQTTTLDLN